MLTEGRMPPEHFAQWLKESAYKMRILRDAVKPYADGSAPAVLLDAATIMALAEPLAAAMTRLSKHVQGEVKPAKSRSKRK